MYKTHITFGFKSKKQAPWFMIIKEYLLDGEVVDAKIIFEFWPRYFKNKWLKAAREYSSRNKNYAR